MGKSEEDEIPWFSAMTTFFGYSVLILFGQMRDFFGSLTGASRYNKVPEPGYAPLFNDWENFFTRRLYHRVQDCWNRPIAGPPKANRMLVATRQTTNGNFTLDYNYLGFADDWRDTCRDAVMGTVDRFGMSMCGSAGEGAYTTLHRRLERTVAEFVGKPDSIVFNMGYGTNSTAIPALMGKGSLILSDSLNHTSIVNGARSSGATIRVFKHNDMRNLEGLLRNALAEGQPRTHRPWKKILVMVEGVYSMEGEMVNLPGVVELTKRYKAYLYLDEAHSIGAVGNTGRGVCEHFGVDPSDVDIMMGTFTKSFGAMGGYIAASKDFIDYLRHSSTGYAYSQNLAPLVAAQILRSFDIIMGRDGSSVGADKLQSIKDNANYFRQRLIDMGCLVYGHTDSPIIPVLLFDACKVAAVSRTMLKHGVAVVGVGYPATPLLMARARFCISAGHTRETLDCALEVIEKTLDMASCIYNKGRPHLRPLSPLQPELKKEL